MANVATKFCTIKQNNSGGIFDHDEAKGVGYAICVEAVDVAHARSRLQGIIDSYPASYDCPCCGERWSFYLDEDDGTDEPTKYGGPLTGGWGIPAYVHHLGGRIEPRADAAA